MSNAHLYCIGEGSVAKVSLLDAQEDQIQCGAVIAMADQCECSDPGCYACLGHCTRDSQFTLYRIDMEDRTGTEFCDLCAEDAFNSGLFSDQKNFYSR